MLDTGDTTWNHVILQHTNLARKSAPLERGTAGMQVTKQLVSALSVCCHQLCAKELHLIKLNGEQCVFSVAGHAVVHCC